MPTYSWRCYADGSSIELYQTFTDDSIPNCPVCQKPMSKIIHATPTHFRGGGWGGK
jgi:putative FmdB family regulatory protein